MSWRLGVQWSSTTTSLWLGYTVLFAIDLFLLNQMARLGTPVKDAAGHITSPGADLSASGLTEYMMDALYLTWAILTFSLFTDKAWLIAFTVHAFVLPSFFDLRSSSSFPFFFFFFFSCGGA